MGFKGKLLKTLILSLIFYFVIISTFIFYPTIKAMEEQIVAGVVFSNGPNTHPPSSARCGRPPRCSAEAPRWPAPAAAPSRRRASCPPRSRPANRSRRLNVFSHRPPSSSSSAAAAGAAGAPRGVWSHIFSVDSVVVLLDCLLRFVAALPRRHQMRFNDVVVVSRRLDSR